MQFFAFLIPFFLLVTFSVVLADASNDVTTATEETTEYRKISKTECDSLLSSNPLRELMENVCIHCHEFFSDSRPNLRSMCRANCFENDDFKFCVRMFSSSHRARRHAKHHHSHSGSH